MNFKRIHVLLQGLLLLMGFVLRAQTPLSAKPDSTLEPFMGIIEYKITYPGIKDASLLAMLPDSQVVIFSGRWVMSQSFGGQATEMGLWTLWSVDSGTYWMVSNTEKTVHTLPKDHVSPKTKLTKNTSAKKKLILAHPCVQYDYTHDQLTDSWWMNDSLFIIRPTVDSLVHLVPPFFASGKRSIPLRMVRKSAAGTTVVEAVSIMQGNTLIPVPPQDYQWIEFNPLLPRHPLTGLKDEKGK